MATKVKTCARIGLGTPTLSFLKFEGKSTEVNISFPEDFDLVPTPTKKDPAKMYLRGECKVNGIKTAVSGYDIDALTGPDGKIMLGASMKVTLRKTELSTIGRDGKPLKVNTVKLIDAGVAHTEWQWTEVVTA